MEIFKAKKFFEWKEIEKAKENKKLLNFYYEALKEAKTGLEQGKDLFEEF